MRRQRKKQPWWLSLLGWILSVGMIFVAIPAVGYVTTRQREAAPYLVIIALVVAVGMSIAYFTGSIRTWIIGPVIGFCVGFSFMTALVEGWDTQLQFALMALRAFQVVGTVALVVGLIWMSRRLNRNVSAVTRLVGEEIRTDALFGDDGQRILVYADKRRLLIFATFMIAVTLLLFAGFHWAISNDMPLWLSLLFGLGFGMCGLASALCVIRLVMQTPSLVIGPDGILDNASLVVNGRGMLRWDEILTVFQLDDKRTLGVTYHYLAIVIADFGAVRQRLARWKLLLVLVAPRAEFVPSSVTVFRALLDRSPHQLAGEIMRYVVEHAPKGWHSPLLDEAREGESAEAE